MKLLLVSQNFAPEFRGGVERVVEVTAQALRSRGHEVRILCGSERDDGPARLEEQFEGLSVVRLLRAPRPLASLDLTDGWVGEAFESEVASFQPDFVHFHHWWNLSDCLVRRAAALGLRTAVTLHDHFASCPIFFRLRAGHQPCSADPAPDPCGSCAGDRLGLPTVAGRAIGLRHAGFTEEIAAASAIIAPSQSHADLAMAHFPAERDRVRVLPLGSEASGAQLAAPPAREDPRLVVLHFGNLSRVKGVEVLLRAVRDADPEGRRMKLILAGRKVEDDLDLRGADHRPHFQREDLAGLAAEADLAVFPSLALESYGLVVDEALHAGLPVIVSDRGALKERVGGRGRVVPGGDVAALSSALSEIADDRDQLARWRATDAPEIWGTDRHVDELEALYATAPVMPIAKNAVERHLARRLAFAQRNLLDAIAALRGGTFA